MVTGIYAALFAVMQYGLTIYVVKRRLAAKISLGDGGDEELLKRIRAHGNFVETVPMVLILMLIAELSLAPYWALNAVGVCMLLGRGMHFYAIMNENFKIRAPSMYLTVFAWFGGAALCMWTAITTILS